jgi:hypothetical protein
LRSWSIDPKVDRLWLRASVVLWVLFAIGTGAYCLHYLGTHTVSTVYWTAARQWWASQEMYGSKEMTLEGRHGFLYFPVAAIAFTPFAYLPLAWAELAWRAASLALLMWALWRACTLVGGERRGLWFGVATPLALPVIALSASNGQANMVVAAAMTLGICEVAARRWWIATAWLILGLALKPHTMALIMVIAVLEREMLWRLCVGVAALVALPFLRPDWQYAWQQHLSFVEKMRVATRPPPGANQDLIGLLWTFGAQLPDRAWTVIRAAGAAGTLVLCWLARRRFERDASLVYTLSLAIVFIMLFNPRTEAPTHAMMAVVLGLFGARELIVRPRPLAWCMVIVSVLMAVSHEVIKPKNSWVLPLLDLWIGAYLVGSVLSGSGAFPARVPRVDDPAHEPDGPHLAREEVPLRRGEAICRP